MIFKVQTVIYCPENYPRYFRKYCRRIFREKASSYGIFADGIFYWFFCWHHHTMRDAFWCSYLDNTVVFGSNKHPSRTQCIVHELKNCVMYIASCVLYSRQPTVMSIVAGSYHFDWIGHYSSNKQELFRLDWATISIHQTNKNYSSK